MISGHTNEKKIYSAKNVINLEIKALQILKNINNSFNEAVIICKVPIQSYFVWCWKKWIDSAKIAEL